MRAALLLLCALAVGLLAVAGEAASAEADADYVFYMPGFMGGNPIDNATMQLYSGCAGTCRARMGFLTGGTSSCRLVNA